MRQPLHALSAPIISAGENSAAVVLEATLQIFHGQGDCGKVVCLKYGQVNKLVAGEGEFGNPKFIRRATWNSLERTIAVLIK